MGTDIILDWSGKSESEKAAQLECQNSSRLFVGEIGYIRAAIGMKRENGFLGFVFPDEYWFNKSGKPMPYDFGRMLPKMKEASEIYVKSAQEGSEPEFGEPYRRAVALDIATAILMKRKGYEPIHSTTDMKGEDVLEWLKSVWRFFELGLQKQNQGKNPSVFISW
jgi:hypothetical protein